MQDWNWGFLFLPVLSGVLHWAYIKASWGIQDIANERSLHTGAVKKSGGFVFLSLFLVSFAWNQGLGSALTLPVLVGLVFFGALGLIDDFFSLPALLRLGGEVVFLTLWFRYFFPQLPLWGFAFGDVWFTQEWISLGMTSVALVFAINLVNFMDGMDSYVVSHLFLSLSFFPFLFAPGFAWGSEISLVLILLLGSVLGFLWFNLPQAKLFMGDVGSLGLGFLWVSFPFLGATEIASSSPLLYFFLFPVFWADGITTILHRLFQGKNILKAHREHIYQMLTETNLGKKGSLLICLIANIPAYLSLLIFGKSLSVLVTVILSYFLSFFFFRFLLHRNRKNLDPAL